MLFLSPATEIYRQKIVEVAKDKEFDDLLFAIASEEDFAQELKELGLDDSGEDINIGIWDADKKKYKLEPDDEFDSDVLRDFIRKWQNGTHWFLMVFWILLIMILLLYLSWNMLQFSLYFLSQSDQNYSKPTLHVDAIYMVLFSRWFDFREFHKSVLAKISISIYGYL